MTEHIYAGAFNVEDRRSRRKRVVLKTRIRELGYPNVAIDVTNVSAVGFSGNCVQEYRVPSVVAIALPGLGEIRARLVRAEPGRLSGEFIQRLDETQMAILGSDEMKAAGDGTGEPDAPAA